jgi:hypothetical protein
VKQGIRRTGSVADPLDKLAVKLRKVHEPALGGTTAACEAAYAAIPERPAHLDPAGGADCLAPRQKTFFQAGKQC